MTFSPEKLLNGQKTALESFVKSQQTALDGMEKLVDLYMKAARASLEDMTSKSQEALQIKDPQQVTAFAANVAQNSPEKAAHFSKGIYDICSKMQSQLMSIAENHIAQQQKISAEVFETLAKNAPAGSEGALAILKSTLANANTAYDSLTKAAKQAAEVTENNINAVANAAPGKRAAGTTTAK